MYKIAILTRPDFRSPRILADSLKSQLEEQGAAVEIFYEIDLLNRLVSFRDSQLSFHFWLKRKLQHFRKDINLLRILKGFDAVVISECIPNGFIRRLFNIEKIRKIIKKPIGFYEVYYLGNGPTQIDFLINSNEALIDRYDFHLSVGRVTEIKSAVNDHYFPIGINGSLWNLKPLPKNQIIAILDFVYPGNEFIRETQIRALNLAGIKYISLDKPYTITEIRKIYQQGSIYFMQSYEAFGLPLLECLCSGCQIFTPESWWPMSWRLNENPEIHGEGLLPNCFTVYKNEEELIKQLITFRENYDLVETPKKVFENFLSHYPDFYHGNETEMKRFMNSLSK
jgi:hypothetical protein